MGRGDHEELPPVEVLGAATEIRSLQEVSRGPKGPRGRRGLGLIVAASVVGLLVAGLVLGDDDEAPAAAERGEATTTSTQRRPTTTRPSTTTSTTTAPAVAPLFTGHDIRGWLLSGSGDGWTLVDIASGDRPEPRLPFDDPYSTRAGTGGVVMLVPGEARFYDLRDPTAASEPVNLGPADLVLAPLDGDRVWLVEGTSDPDADQVRARLVDLTGRELRSFPVPAEPFRSLSADPSSAAVTDGVLFARGGRVYLASEAGVDAVAIGELVGGVGASVLVFTCDDDAAACGIDLLTPSGAVIRRLDVEPSSPGFGWGVSKAADGRFALVTHRSDLSGERAMVTLHRADGTTIATVEVDGYMQFAPRWLPDDAGLVTAHNGGIAWMHQTSDGWVLEDLPALRSIQSEGVLPIISP